MKKFLKRPEIWIVICVAIGFCAYMFSVIYLPAILHTVYAPGYSSNKFAQIQEGMTAEQVIALVGEPLDKHPHSDCVIGGTEDQCVHYTVDKSSTWWYSQQDETNTHYFMRYLDMRDNKVHKKVSEYYAD